MGAGAVIEIQGLWWPDDVGDKWDHSLHHVHSVEAGIRRCTTRRTAIQAGGNIGLWPRRLAQCFERVFTFEPDALSRECLIRNVPQNVTVSGAALGRTPGQCRIKHKSLGSHRVAEDVNGDVPIITIDSLDRFDVDFLQLDIEGYELHALEGAILTITRSRPVIQLELRGFTHHFGKRDDDVRQMLESLGYRQVATAPGSDFIFRWCGGAS